MVDDSQILLYTRKLILEGAGYRVLSASTAKAALSTFTSQQVDLAVVDYFLPDMTGEELCRQMKARKPNVPLILSSGTMPEPPSDCADYFVLKGSSPEALLQNIARLTRRAA